MLIPNKAISDWLEDGIEIIKDEDRIIIQPKAKVSTEKNRVLQILADADLLFSSPWEITFPETPDGDLAQLSQRFGQGNPLSELILRERDESW